MPLLAIGASVILAGLAMWAMAILGVFGIGGSVLTFYLLPIVLLAPTPRSWWFLALSATALSAAPAISYAIQLMRPIEVEGRTWSPDTGWVPITRPEPAETITTALIIWMALFVVILSSLALMKRIGIAAKQQL